jgi:hypothetical protein
LEQNTQPLPLPPLSAPLPPPLVLTDEHEQTNIHSTQPQQFQHSISLLFNHNSVQIEKESEHLQDDAKSINTTGGDSNSYEVVPAPFQTQVPLSTHTSPDATKTTLNQVDNVFKDGDDEGEDYPPPPSRIYEARSSKIISFKRKEKNVDQEHKSVSQQSQQHQTQAHEAQTLSTNQSKPPQIQITQNSRTSSASAVITNSIPSSSSSQAPNSRSSLAALSAGLKTKSSAPSRSQSAIPSLFLSLSLDSYSNKFFYFVLNRR